MITICKRCGFKNYDPYLRLSACGHCHQDPYTKEPEVPFVEREGHLDEMERRKGQFLTKMATLMARQPGKTRAFGNFNGWRAPRNEEAIELVEKEMVTNYTPPHRPRRLSYQTAPWSMRVTESKE